ncbi:MAG: DUF5703 family protein [Actinomycetales bacterium]
MSSQSTARRRRSAEYEYRVLVVPRGESRASVQERLTDEAEYGRWELARVVVYIGGARRIWLRRRIMRVQRTV